MTKLSCVSTTSPTFTTQSGIPSTSQCILNTSDKNTLPKETEKLQMLTEETSENPELFSKLRPLHENLNNDINKKTMQLNQFISNGELNEQKNFDEVSMTFQIDGQSEKLLNKQSEAIISYKPHMSTVQTTPPITSLTTEISMSRSQPLTLLVTKDSSNQKEQVTSTNEPQFKITPLKSFVEDSVNDKDSETLKKDSVSVKNLETIFEISNLHDKETPMTPNSPSIFNPSTSATLNLTSNNLEEDINNIKTTKISKTQNPSEKTNGVTYLETSFPILSNNYNNEIDLTITSQNYSSGITYGKLFNILWDNSCGKLCCNSCDCYNKSRGKVSFDSKSKIFIKSSG